MLIQIDPEQPESWLIGRAADMLRRGAVAIIPTDTVYGLACDINNPKAIKRIYKLKNLDPKKPLAILVSDMATVGQYARRIDNTAFRTIKRVLPGAYTFIFDATPEVPKIMLRKRKTIGIRMPDNPIVLDLLNVLDAPLLTTSIRTPNDDFINDPIEIEEIYGHNVDLVIDGGILAPEPSTVVDFSEDVPLLIREGKGDVETLGLF